MAQAPVLTVTPKLLGKHLREIRRKKGLSLSEVARGAGLSRRELVAYERGKVPIPESDLWVLAGSCGVDAAELMPPVTTPELDAGPTTMGDTVAQLRRSQDDAELAPYLATLHRLQALPPGKKIPVKDRELDAIASALGRDSATIESRLSRVMHVPLEEAARLREMILAPVGGRRSPRALESAPVFSAAAPAFTDMATDATGAVDVFEELARLPDPLPLPDPGPLPDMLATPPPPEGAVELVDGRFGTPGSPAPVLVDAATAGAGSSAFDAPPIDVAMRQTSDAWADWGKGPASPPLASRDPGAWGGGEPEPSMGGPHDSAPPTDWDSPAWQPPAPDGQPFGGTAPAFWEGTDDWSPPADVPADGWNANQWPTDLAGQPDTADPFSVTDPFAPADPFTPAAPFTAADPFRRDLGADTTSDAAGWNHEPDPEAVSTGFYVDWGTPGDDEPPAWQALLGPDTEASGTDGSFAEPNGFTVSAELAAAELFLLDGKPPASEPGDDTHGEDDPVLPEGPDNALPPISWHADNLTTTAPHSEHDGEAEPQPIRSPAVSAETMSTKTMSTKTMSTKTMPVIPMEQFTVAGEDWQLGNALPLVEVRGQGSLVMRRADERWALADVTTPQHGVVEVDMDFRSGPGLGVLFRASVDDDGRMSGYSFDIDPIYDGGGYLVRQWQSDRELWNPIARVSGGDATSMYGALTVRLVLDGDHLVALVNGVEVLQVESLKQASADRGREAADGSRVGVQAWSSSDLVLETLRVAEL
jgi:transcriptional regulator with XRE-family HTH domain